MPGSNAPPTTRAGRPRRFEAQDELRLLLDAALAVMERNGYVDAAVADILREADMSTRSFYRHFESRQQLVAEAVQRALTQGSAWTIAVGQTGGEQGYTALVDGYLSPWHRDHPESGCGVAGVAADAARAAGPERGSYTRQVKECLAVLTGLTGHADRQAAEREAVLTLSALVGAICVARAVDDPDLSGQILASTAAALKQRVLKRDG